jgi:hypothetical protein
VHNLKFSIHDEPVDLKGCMLCLPCKHALQTPLLPIILDMSVGGSFVPFTMQPFLILIKFRGERWPSLWCHRSESLCATWTLHDSTNLVSGWKDTCLSGKDKSTNHYFLDGNSRACQAKTSLPTNTCSAWPRLYPYESVR